MSLRQTVQQAIESGINALDDLAERATYTGIAPGTYNATTGAPVNTSTPYSGVPMVLTGYSKEEIDGENVLAQDMKAIIATRSLTPVPTITDKITRGDGSVWSVISIKTDPAGAAWVLQVRRP